MRNESPAFDRRWSAPRPEQKKKPPLELIEAEAEAAIDELGFDEAAHTTAEHARHIPRAEQPDYYQQQAAAKRRLEQAERQDAARREKEADKALFAHIQRYVKEALEGNPGVAQEIYNSLNPNQVESFLLAHKKVLREIFALHERHENGGELVQLLPHQLVELHAFRKEQQQKLDALVERQTPSGALGKITGFFRRAFGREKQGGGVWQRDELRNNIARADAQIHRILGTGQ